MLLCRDSCGGTKKFASEEGYRLTITSGDHEVVIRRNVNEIVSSFALETEKEYEAVVTVRTVD